MSITTERWTLLNKFRGLHTARDSDDLPFGKSPNLKNVRINGSNFQGAKGYELIGTRNSTAGEITSQYTYNRNDGDQVMVRVKDDGSTGTLEWYDTTNEEWYTLLASLTTGKIMGFTEFNSTTKNQMIFCNGEENMSVWTGAVTRLTATVTATDTKINVVSTADFPATGTIIYNGTEIAYSAKAATTFTVASAHASAGADDGVAEAADDSTHSAVTEGNILLTAKNRLWIAGQAANPCSVDYSDEGDAFTYTGGSGRADSGTEKILNIGGSVTGLSEKNDKVIILGSDGGVSFDFSYPTSTTKAPIYNQLFFSPGQGCLSSKSVFKVNNEVYFCNRNGVQALTDAVGTERIGTKSITRDILPTLQDYVFDEAAVIYHNKEDIVLVACKTDSDQAGNDIVIGVDFFLDTTVKGEELTGFGLTRFDWPVADWAILANELYFGSSLEMNSHKGFSTNQNDGAPRTILYVTERFNFKDPFQEKGNQYAAVKGYIKDGTDIEVEIQYDAGFRGTQSKTIESTGDYVGITVLNDMGAFAIGTNPIGANIASVSDLKPFLVYLDIGTNYRFNDIQFSFESETDGGTFLISHVGMVAETEGHAIREDITI